MIRTLALALAFSATTANFPHNDFAAAIITTSSSMTSNTAVFV